MRNTAEGGGGLERTTGLLAPGPGGDRWELSVPPTRPARQVGALLADPRIPAGPTLPHRVRHEKWLFLPLDSCHPRRGVGLLKSQSSREPPGGGGQLLRREQRDQEHR